MAKPTFIALDQTAGELIIARQPAGGKKPVQLQRVPADGEAAREALGPVQAAVLGGTARLITALPATAGFARWLPTPFTAPGKARRVLPSLLDLQLPFPVEQCVATVPTLIPRTDEEGLAGLALAARIPEAEAWLQPWQERGVEPHLLFHEAPALWLLQAIPAGPSAVLYLGDTHTTVVTGTGETMGSAHGLPLALSPEDEASTQRLAMRIQQILRTRFDGAPVTLLWTGPRAVDPARVARVLAAIPADLVASSATDPDPAGARARALLRQAAHPDADRYNLRQGPLAHTGDAGRSHAEYRRSLVLAMAAALLLLALNAGWRLHLSARNHRLQDQLIDRAATLSGLPPAAIPRGEELFTVRQALAGAGEETVHPFRRAFLPGAAHSAADMIAAAAAADATLTELRLHADGFRLRGTAPTRSAAETLRDALPAAALTGSLQMDDPGPDGRIPFTLEGGTPHGG